MKSCALSCHVLEIVRLCGVSGKGTAYSVADRDEGMGGCSDLESADRGHV